MSDHGTPNTMKRGGAISRLLAATGNRVLRTRDLVPFYSQPSKEAARLVRRGVLAKLAAGYYVVVPEHRRGQPWRPEVEDVALALGVADYGLQGSALIGPSAARLLGALPRALSVAVLAVTVHRSPLSTVYGWVVFSKRDISRLDLQRVTTELVVGYSATAEQSILDLAATPRLGGITEEQAAEARRALLWRCDLDIVADLARIQHRRAAFARIRAEAAALV
jgi:hypothetical protein